MEQIKILRLKNGEDIIGYVSDIDNGKYDITEPMSILLDMRTRDIGVIMRSWIPLQLVKTNKVQLSNNDIMFLIDPADDFCEYYSNTVMKFRELLKAKEIIQGLTDQEIEENFQEMYSEFGDKTLH